MQGQLFKIFRGMFAIDLADKKEIAYWAQHFEVTVRQLKDASEIASSQSVNGLQQALYKLGYAQPSADMD